MGALVSYIGDVTSTPLSQIIQFTYNWYLVKLFVKV